MKNSKPFFETPPPHGLALAPSFGVAIFAGACPLDLFDLARDFFFWCFFSSDPPQSLSTGNLRLFGACGGFFSQKPRIFGMENLCSSLCYRRLRPDIGPPYGLLHGERFSLQFPFKLTKGGSIVSGHADRVTTGFSSTSSREDGLRDPIFLLSR